MKKALEIDDIRELAQLLTAAKQQIIFVFQYGRFATGSLTRRYDFSRLVALCGSRRPMSTASCRIMFTERR